MASTAIAASFLPLTAKHPSAATRRALIVAKASAAANDASKPNLEMNRSVQVESWQGRRELVAAAVTVAAATLAKAAMADEPKRGSAEAKQKYAPVCVTMPTARICRN
ncbi:photosystem II 5 kDa protein, chloroplastic [Momordica charantia]|uniref:Photosystem II 5 kDa protein, chloroplastic n=1 Tax=Momordica charantia TaxID=3673 RepID=A0A6J1D6G0_MOMCH|nr:photosystem II 5 kDa protein, chloroplastic [Momordica charantia]